MAEYVEVMKQKKRMCNSTLCCKCDIFHLSGESVVNCPQFISNDPSKAEKIIMAWAAEHPEPVYPTWGEYLASIGVLKPAQAKNAYEVWFTQLCTTNIPAEFAEKLGIEPKSQV